MALQAAPAPFLPPPAPCCPSWPLPHSHSSSGLTAPAFQVNPFVELFPLVLSHLDFPPLSCYLHPAFLTYPNHLGPLLLLPCQWPCWRGVPPAVDVPPGLSAPFHHLLSLVKAALQIHNPYSLQIPLDKVSAPITLPAAHMVSLVSSDKPNTSVRQPRSLLSTASAPLPFYWQSW